MLVYSYDLSQCLYHAVSEVGHNTRGACRIFAQGG
ncbi:hypothetical protein ACP70R_039736 [Stipagrostis hirtigluma subsp. patula]